MEIKFSEEQKMNAVKLYQDGKTISEVESLTEISSSYIKNLLKKHNVAARGAGFQKRNTLRQGLPHSSMSKDKISFAHKASGHKPSPEATAKGQPLTLKIRWKNHIKDPIDQLIKSYKRGALKRSLEFCLSREEFETLINRSCYYCGTQPSLRNINGCDLICNGVDREDNSKGYISNNCLTACKICNVMKSKMSFEEFIQHCRQIGSRFVDAR